MARETIRNIFRSTQKIIVHWKLIVHILFIASFFTAFWGAFEMAFDAFESGMTASPIWSGTFGIYIPHHYIIGFIGIMICYVWLTRKDFFKTYKKIQALVKRSRKFVGRKPNPNPPFYARVKKMSKVEDAGKVPELSWKPLSYKELCEALQNRENLPTAIDAYLLILVQEEKARAWLDDKGKIRYQYKPDFLRNMGR